MPAAVAGSTMLARDMQARTPLAAVQPTASAAVPHDRTPGIA